jgi:hypothetical protein
VADARPKRRSGPPDFIGVGTLQSGTGWWNGMLLRHPEVQSRRRGKRSLHFFDDFCERPMTDSDVAQYHRAFRRRRAGRITGEWTSRYTYDPWTPPLLARAAPGAKLIVMVSDPIDRYRKRLARMRAQARSEDDYLYMADATGRGHYGAQLRQLLTFNDRERVLVLQFERCAADPLGEYARTCRFLGIDDGFVPRKLRRQVARRSQPRAVTRALRAVGLLPLVLRLTRSDPQLEPADLWPDIEASLHDDLDGEVAALTELVPDLDLTLWPNFAPEGASDRS